MHATGLSRLIRSRRVSATEVMQAFLAQIRRVNPKVNAICTFVSEEEALRAAREADARLARRASPGALHGFPFAVKDLALTAGIRTTYGSRIYKDFVPAQDALFVERLKAAGAIIIGKTNTPEFGAGSQTFNEVFGATRNPYDLTKTCGGSSGRGRGARLRNGADRRRERYRRLAAQPGGVLQRRRISTVAGPRAERIVELVAI